MSEKCEGTGPQKLVSSILYTADGEEIKRKVVEEIKVPDPTPEAAAAAIEKFKQQEGVAHADGSR